MARGSAAAYVKKQDSSGPDGGREFSTKESKTLPGWTGTDPYDHARSGASYLRDGASTAEEFGEGKRSASVPSEPEKAPDELRPEAKEATEEQARKWEYVPHGREEDLSWEADMQHHPGDQARAYIDHKRMLASQFKKDLMAKAEDGMRDMRERARDDIKIERNRKTALDYAMANYGDQANLKGISERAMVAKQVNDRELTGPGAEASFSINQKLGMGKASLVVLPDGRMVAMDPAVAVAVMSQFGPEEARGQQMASLFKDYVQEHDAGFMQAIESNGGMAALAKDRTLLLDPGQSDRLKSLWRGVSGMQDDVAKFEALPTESLTPRQYEALGLDPDVMRHRRLMTYGDPAAGIACDTSKDPEYNGRRLPTGLRSADIGRYRSVEDEYGASREGRALPDLPSETRVPEPEGPSLGSI